MISRERLPALAILAVALLLRVLFLDIKPPHFDEGVNGLFVDQMTEQGFYRYDPGNYHGPLHFYALHLSQTLFGRNLWAMRMPVVLLSVASVALALAFAPLIGRAAARWAAAAMAVSPAMIFYGRYAIHETWLLLFLLLTAWGIGGMWSRGDRRSLWAVATGLCGMILTKETYIIHVGCLLLAIPTLWLVERISKSAPMPWAQQTWTQRDVALAVGTNFAALLLFYSGFMMHLEGIAGLWKTFAMWFETGADGHGHEKWRGYWISLMARCEWPALLGVAGGATLLRPGSPRFLRYLAIAGAGTLAAYSVIPYKTPWCVLVLLWPFLLLFGWLISNGNALRSARLVAGVLVLSVSAAVAIRLNFFRYTDYREPYVYVQTHREIALLIDPLTRLVEADPRAQFLRGHVILDDYHPLPWLLGDFPRIGYYKPDASPRKADAAFILINKERAAVYEARLARSYFRESFRLRDGQTESTLYLDAERFGPLFPGRAPEVRRLRLWQEER